MLLEDRLRKLKRLHELLQEEESILQEVNLLNAFQNNKFTTQQFIARDELEKVEAKVDSRCNTSCSTLVDMLELLGLEPSNKYHVINGEYIEIQNGVIYYVCYPYSVYGGQGHTPASREEITMQEAIRYLKSHNKI